jgi:hypothetical protein
VDPWARPGRAYVHSRSLNWINFMSRVLGYFDVSSAPKATVDTSIVAYFGVSAICRSFGIVARPIGVVAAAYTLRVHSEIRIKYCILN